MQSQHSIDRLGSPHPAPRIPDLGLFFFLFFFFYSLASLRKLKPLPLPMSVVTIGANDDVGGWHSARKTGICSRRRVEALTACVQVRLAAALSALLVGGLACRDKEMACYHHIW